jgi:RNA polymerase sigma-70 factor (ECF subfamily)
MPIDRQLQEKKLQAALGENGTMIGNGVVTQDFSSVVESHRQQIFRFLLVSSRDVDVAQTLTQECFLKAYRNWSRFRGESSVGTWLMRIAINLQKDHWRSRRIQFWRQTRTHSVDLDIAREWVASGDVSPEQHVLAREQVRRVWEAVKGMKERQRTVFLLRFVEELKVNEIALATGLHEGTVKSHLSRALRRVRAELGR